MPILPPRRANDVTVTASDRADPTGLNSLLDFLARNPRPVVVDLGDRPINRAA